MPRTVLISSLAVVLALAAACSGAPTTNLFAGSNGSDSNDSGSGATSGGSSGGSSGSPRSDSGPAPDAGGSLDSSTEGSADAEPGDAVAAEAAGPDAAPPGVSCPIGGQATTCQSGEVCCVTTSGLTQSGRCQQSTAPCTGGIPVSCASAADCKAGEVCCGTQTATLFGTTYQNVSCKTSCSGLGQVAFCDPKAGGCSAGTTCQASTVVPSYTVCR